jgi:Protein of unknown function (DUF732)
MTASIHRTRLQFMDAHGVPPEKTAPAAPSEEIEAITAWSREDDAPDVAPFRPSRSRSALLWSVAIGLALGTAGSVAWFGVTLYGERGIPAASAEPPSPSTEPPPPPTPDQQFLTSLHQIGVSPEADAAALIGDGHHVCQALGHREPFNEVVADIQSGAWVNSSQANIETSREFAMAAIDVYCPQYQAGAPPLLHMPPILLNPK